MHVIFWEYVPKEGLEGQFERAYGPMGSWGALFSRSGDYKGRSIVGRREKPISNSSPDIGKNMSRSIESVRI
jgi:hypothetical protein